MKDYNQKVLNDLTEKYGGVDGVRKRYDLAPYMFKGLFKCTNCGKSVSVSTVKYVDFDPNMRCYECQRTV